MAAPIKDKRRSAGNIWFWSAYVAGLAAVLGHAALLRFSLPQTPLIDPDFWG